MGDDFRADFLGVFAVLTRGERVLFVANERTIAGRTARTWDLPGGRVERGELLREALARELREETGLALRGEPKLLFVQEGRRVHAGRPVHAWRSFFFAVEAEPGEPEPGNEVLDVRWMDRATMRRELTAPYHDSFRTWVESGGTWFQSEWAD